MPPPWPVAHPVNREQGMARYQALLSPAQYRARLARGDTAGLAPPFEMPAGEPPVLPLQLVARRDMTPDVVRYELAAADGSALPPFEAGAHIDVVIAPEYQRPYSLAGNPADPSRYVLGVQREASGRGGSALMHRAFRPGRVVFVSRPRNHFGLVEDASLSLLFAGGIGITPLITMAHRLHALQRPFVLHYSAPSRAQAGFVDELLAAPWHAQVQLHFKDEGRRAELARLLPRLQALDPAGDPSGHQAGPHLYTCGSPRYMDAVFAAALAAGWSDASLHREYFVVPAAPARQNHAFVIELRSSGRLLEVPAQRNATDVLAEAGVVVPTKCSDGLCGVCAAAYDASRSAAVDHRDHVLSNTARAERIILCCSRVAEPGGRLVLTGL
jgi:ferredoxin-NADP reductase